MQFVQIHVPQQLLFFAFDFDSKPFSEEFSSCRRCQAAVTYLVSCVRPVLVRMNMSCIFEGYRTSTVERGLVKIWLHQFFKISFKFPISSMRPSGGEIAVQTSTLKPQSARFPIHTCSHIPSSRTGSIPAIHQL